MNNSNYNKYPNDAMHKNLSRVPRTMSEAMRDAEYASPIHTFASDAKLSLLFVLEAGFTIVRIGLIATPLIALVYLASKWIVRTL